MEPEPSTPGAPRAAVHGSPGVGPRYSGLLRLLSPLFGVGVAAGYLVRAALPHPSVAAPAAGASLLALALVAGCYLAWSRRRLESFIKGAQGEEAVARELSRLPDSFEVYHGVRLPDVLSGPLTADHDHIVVGPAGVFSIETKNWNGRITLTQGRILFEGKEPDRAPLGQVREAAAALAQRLETVCGCTVPVTPVLVFASKRGRDAIDADGVTVCGPAALCGQLRAAGGAPLHQDAARKISAYLLARTDAR